MEISEMPVINKANWSNCGEHWCGTPAKRLSDQEPADSAADRGHFLRTYSLELLSQPTITMIIMTISFVDLTNLEDFGELKRKFF